MSSRAGLWVTSGFTLIELVISFAIFAILSGGAFIYIGNFNDRKNLDLAKDEVESYIRLARNMAVSSKLPEGMGASSQLKLVGVETEADGKNLIVYGEDTLGDKVNYFEKEVNLGVKISGISPESGLKFSIFSGKSVGEVDVEVTLTLVNGGDTRKIFIDKYGKIQ